MTSPEELENFVFKLAYLCGRHISIAQPILDGTLPDGSRAQVTYGTEVTPKGSTFTIRKFKRSPLTITDLIIYNALSPEIAAYYWFLIENRHSVLIGGDIGGGKTSMLNAISLFIRPTLKIVSIEDTQEIRLATPELGNDGYTTRLRHWSWSCRRSWNWQHQHVRSCFELRLDKDQILLL